MNQRIVTGIILVFVLAVFSQCTVQKRLYRKGYYISFHKTPKRGTEAKEEKPLLVVSEKDSTKTVDQNLSLETPSDMNDFPLSEEVTLPKTVKREYYFSQLRLTDLKDKVDYVGKLQFKLAKWSTKTTTNDDKKASIKALVIVGCLMILVGIGITVLSFWGELIFSLVGLLITIVGLIMLLLSLFLALESRSDNKEMRKRQKEERKKREQSLSEEDWAELKHKQYKKAVRTTILLIVLFFGISLFALAVGDPMPLIAITGAMFLIFIAFVWLTYKSKRPEESAAN